MKTSELTGPALDWAVAKCENITLAPARGYTGAEWAVDGDVLDLNTGEQINDGDEYAPSRLWAQGGPIIEREKIGLDYYPDGGHRDGGEWGALCDGGNHESFGPTPLIAAMRCYCCAELGDEIEIPEELQ